MIHAPEWKPFLDDYRELNTLKFVSEEEIDKAIDILWHDEHLKDLPHDIVDGLTLIVPKESTKYFRDKKLKFRASSLLSPDDLSSEELASLRQQQGLC